MNKGEGKRGDVGSEKVEGQGKEKGKRERKRGKKRRGSLTTTNVNGKNIIDTLVKILILSPCSIALLLSFTLLPLNSCSLSDLISVLVVSFFSNIPCSSPTALSSSCLKTSMRAA